MLTVRPKISELAFRVFGRSVHPELFEIFDSRTIVRDQYQLRVDITGSGHCLTWQRDGATLCEIAASVHQPLPANRLLFDQTIRDAVSSTIPVAPQVEYAFQYQIEHADWETLAAIQAHLFSSRPCEGMMFQFHSSGRMALGGISYINIQSRINRVHVRAFHTFPDASFVMKSESTFIVNESEA